MVEENIDTPGPRSDIIVHPSLPSSNFHNQGIRQGEFVPGSPGPKNFVSTFVGLSLHVEMLPPGKPVEESPRCPCGCLQHGETGGFRTRELSSMRLVVHGPEILNYQGTRQAPEDVAPYWKKDSRMWLWKSVRLARRGKRNRMRLGTAFVDLN